MELINEMNMKAIILFLFVFFASNKIYSQTQPELNNDAKMEFERSDNELNRVYQEILKEYCSDTLFINNMKVAQRLWVKFRDAQVRMKYPDSDSSIIPMCQYYYLEELTINRTKELNPWLDGVEEGDVCSGSIKIRNQ